MHATHTGFPVNRAVALNAPFTTARLQLEPLTASHADGLYAVFQDDAVYRWISSDKPANLDALRARWERNATRLSPDGQSAWLAWAVRRVSDGVLVGKLDAVVEVDMTASNVGYLFGPAFWGQGLASEAVAALTQYLLGRGITPLLATVTVGNAASARVLTKAGWQFVRVLPGNDRIRGVLCDDEEYVASR